MSRDGFTYGLYSDAEKRIKRDFPDNPEYLREFKRTVTNLRKTYGVNHGMSNYNLHMLIRDIARGGVKIMDYEEQALSERDEKTERMIILLKEDRRKEMDMLNYSSVGKRASAVKAGRATWRDRLIKSRKFEAVVETDKVLEK